MRYRIKKPGTVVFADNARVAAVLLDSLQELEQLSAAMAALVTRVADRLADELHRAQSE